MNAGTSTTLFSQIQALFERTYAGIGINLEQCLISKERCRELTILAGAQAAELSMMARTFLRTAQGRLHVGIYYAEWLIEQLENHDPRAGLSNNNIRELIAFVEEINHALHAALRFQSGEHPNQDEGYARNLELQAQVDTYLVLLLFAAFFRRPRKLSRMDRRWLRFHMFEARVPNRWKHENLKGRYLETTELAATYTRYLDSLSDARRISEIRTFHALDYGQKREHILSLEDRKA